MKLTQRDQETMVDYVERFALEKIFVQDLKTDVALAPFINGDSHKGL